MLAQHIIETIRINNIAREYHRYSRREQSSKKLCGLIYKKYSISNDTDISYKQWGGGGRGKHTVQRNPVYGQH